MYNQEKEILEKNPKIDTKVLGLISALKTKLPEIAKQKEGSDYNLEPPLGGKLLLTFQKSRDASS
jgi:hypothetical protein